MNATRLLSIIIPAYNEERFIAQLVNKVLAVDLSQFGLTKQVIVIDDGSRDRTATIAEGIAGVALVRMPKNSGKGAAVRAGLAHADGDLVMIQDADLEYEPDDYRPMIEELLRSGADAVYGSRYMARSGSRALAPKHDGQSWSAYLGGRSLSLVQWWFTGRYLTDTVTALKLFRGPAIRGIALFTTGFELDHEITSKILAGRRVIHEVPIRYNPRSREDGKKIGFRDWLRAVRTYARYSAGRLFGLAVSPRRFVTLGLLAAITLAVGAHERHRVSLWLWPPPPRVSAPRQPVGGIYQIADDLYVIPDGGGNTAVFVTTSGVVVVDPKYPENGDATAAQIRRVTDKPITIVINTHCHNDHFGGNTSMPMDAQIVMQERTASNIARLRKSKDPAFFDGRRVRTFRDTLRLFEGADEVDLYYFGPAHTDGDTLVVFRAAGVMHAGDVFAAKAAPIMNLPWGGSPREYAATIERATAGIHGVTRVITGHDGVLEWQAFVDYGEFNRKLLGHVEAAMSAGKDANQARKEFVPAARFADYNLDTLTSTMYDMYKGLTPWWHFW